MWGFSRARWAIRCSLLIILPFSYCYAQDVHFERISIDQGLSQTSVYAIVQDPQGFLWFGTQDGLNRFDGYSFKVYRYRANDTTSISSNHISRLLVSRSGELWVGTAGRGVNRFRGTKDTFDRFMNDPNDSSTLSNNNVWAMYEDRRGTIWVGTDNGLNAFNPKTGACRRFLYEPRNTSPVGSSWVRCIIEDSSGTMWFGHPHGISSFDPGTGVFRYQAFPGKEFLDFVRSHDGGIYAVVAEDVFRLEPERMESGPPAPILKPTLLGIPGLSTVLEADDDLLWVGSSGGLLRVNQSSGARLLLKNQPEDLTSLSDNTVLSLFRDRSGILWVGTFGGINKYVPMSKRFETIQCDPAGSMGPRANRVRSFAEDRLGKIWIGTESGLYRFNPQNRHMDRFVNAPGYPRTINVNHIWGVIALRESPGVTIVCATNGGGVNVLRFPENGDVHQPEVEYIKPNPKNPLSLPAPGPSCLLEDQQGFVWFGTLREGVARYNMHSKTFEVYKCNPNDPTTLSNRAVTTILQTHDGVLWVGTRGGLSRFNEAEKNFTRFSNDPSNPNSLSDDGIESLYEDEQGTLWIGTAGGLNMFDRTTGKFRRFTIEDGLPNDVIYGVLKDKLGNLWCSTNKGIVRFRPDRGLVQSYDVSDGLQSDEYNQGAAFKASDGTFYFGGIEGFNAFHPDSVRDNPHTPDVVFTDLRILNKSLRIGPGESRLRQTISTADELFLTYEDLVITLQFAALEFTNPGRNQYMFKMEGFDRNWTYSGTRREATYTNLDPGTYAFCVRAANNDGIWDAGSRTMRIHIEPPYWKTWWFRLSGLAAIVLMVLAVVRRRIKLLQKEAELQQEISRRLVESQENERRRIATDLHDGLGQELLIIKNRASLANEASDLPEMAKHQIEIIGKTATQSLQWVRRIAKDLRPYHLERLGLASALRSTLEEVADATKIAFDIRIDDVGEFFRGRKDLEVNVFRVVQESVNNIIKHSGASHASVHVENSGDEVHIEIRDDGKGFDPSRVHAPDSKAGLGISGIADRLKVLGGTYRVDSSPGTGTRISIVIPKLEVVKS